MSAHLTSAASQSLTTEFSSPPTYWTGLRTRGSSGSRRAYTDSTGIPPPYRRPHSTDGEPPPPSCGGPPSVRGGFHQRPSRAEVACPDLAWFPAVTRYSAPRPRPHGRGRNTPFS